MSVVLEVRGLTVGGPVRIPSYDFVTHTRSPVEREHLPVRFVLMEGLWLLHHPWLRDRFDLSVFVECEAVGDSDGV